MTTTREEYKAQRESRWAGGTDSYVSTDYGNTDYVLQDNDPLVAFCITPLAEEGDAGLSRRACPTPVVTAIRTAFSQVMSGQLEPKTADPLLDVLTGAGWVGAHSDRLNQRAPQGRETSLFTTNV